MGSAFSADLVAVSSALEEQTNSGSRGVSKQPAFRQRLIVSQPAFARASFNDYPSDQARILFDVDGNLLRYHRRLEGKVLGIAQDKLKCMFPRREFNAGLRLPSPEMKVVLVLWNCLVRIEWLIHIDQ